jgi:hypothetical protein
MPTLADLYTQVQGILPLTNGGSANQLGFARDCLFTPYWNGTGGTLTRGTLVTVPDASGNGQLGKTTVANQVQVTGVVIGRVRIDAGHVAEFVDEDVDDDDMAAVALIGRVWVDVSAAVAVGDYAYASNTDGQAYGASATEVLPASFGMFETATGGAGKAQVRLFGSGPIGQPTQLGGIIATFGDGLTNIQNGDAYHVRVPYNATITRASIFSHQAGSSIVVDIYKDSYANFPPTNADSITNATPPTLATAIKAEDTTLSGWTTSLVKGEMLRFEVESVSAGVYRVEVEIEMRRTG